MKLRLWLLLMGYLTLFLLVYAAYGLPGIVNGHSMKEILPPEPLRELLGGSLFVLIPYLLLYYFYPGRNYLVLVVGTGLMVMLIFWLNYQIYLASPGSIALLRRFFIQHLFFYTSYLLYGIIFYFIRYGLYKELQQRELLLQNRQSELSFLRSQVNPHFLFNSLNNIYSLVYEGSAQALPAIAGLSELLRYMLYDTTESVSLDKELGYIRQYIDLQKLRFDHPICANMVISGNTEKVQIPPLILIPFIENAFKHGDFSGSKEGLNIFIESAPDKTRFHCHNLKNNQEKDATGGIGLVNVKRRLELLYHGSHRLELNDDDKTFTVNLELIHATR